MSISGGLLQYTFNIQSPNQNYNSDFSPTKKTAINSPNPYFCDIFPLQVVHRISQKLVSYPFQKHLPKVRSHHSFLFESISNVTLEMIQTSMPGKFFLNMIITISVRILTNRNLMLMLMLCLHFPYIYIYTYESKMEKFIDFILFFFFYGNFW